MSASSRFRNSMLTGAGGSALLVGYESTQRHAAMAAAAASGHVRTGTMLATAFVILAGLAGAVIFIVASLVSARTRPAPAAAPRPRNYGGRW